jgi:hypothetical protein
MEGRNKVRQMLLARLLESQQVKFRPINGDRVLLTSVPGLELDLLRPTYIHLCYGEYPCWEVRARHLSSACQ